MCGWVRGYFTFYIFCIFSPASAGAESRPDGDEVSGGICHMATSVYTSAPLAGPLTSHPLTPDMWAMFDMASGLPCYYGHSLFGNHVPGQAKEYASGGETTCIWGVPPRSRTWLEELSLSHFFWWLQTSLLTLFLLMLLGWDFNILVSDLRGESWLRPFMVLSPSQSLAINLANRASWQKL